MFYPSPQAGQVFDDIQTIVTLSADWRNTSAELYNVLNNSRITNFVRVSNFVKCEGKMLAQISDILSQVPGCENNCEYLLKNFK